MNSNGATIKQQGTTVQWVRLVEGNFDEPGESSMIRQVKTIQISTYKLVPLWLIYSYSIPKLERVNCHKPLTLTVSEK